MTINLRDKVFFGVLGDEKLRWEVLALEEGKALITACCGVADLPYHVRNEPVTWRKCALRVWLNKDFIQSTFTEAERSAIIPTALEDYDSDYDFDKIDLDYDRVFILSSDEVRRYWPEPQDRILVASERTQSLAFLLNDFYRANAFWLRGESTAAGDKNYISYCDHHGRVNAAYCRVDGNYAAVRPCMWVRQDVLEIAGEEDLRLHLKRRHTLSYFDGVDEVEQDVLAAFTDHEGHGEYVIVRDPRRQDKRLLQLFYCEVYDEQLKAKANKLLDRLARTHYDDLVEETEEILGTEELERMIERSGGLPKPIHYLPEFRVGDTLGIGYNAWDPICRERLKWKILWRDHAHALVLLNSFLDKDMPFFSTQCDEGFLVDRAYEQSDIRKWLNSTFFNEAFCDQEKRVIRPHNTDPDCEWDDDSIPENMDRVFLLDASAAKAYFLSDESRLYPHPELDEGDSTTWWLSTRGEELDRFAVVDASGCINTHGIHESTKCGVRPAMMISLKRLSEM